MAAGATGGKQCSIQATVTSSAFDDANLVVQPLPSGQPKVVQRGGSYGRYLPSGHLVYVSAGTLFAAPFDLDRLEVTGQPLPALEGMRANAGRETRSLPCRPPARWCTSGSKHKRRIADRLDGSEGKTTVLRALPTNWFEARFAPDGSRLAVRIIDKDSDIWVYEWARDALARVTAGGGGWPVWTPDGRRIAFAVRPAGKSRRTCIGSAPMGRATPSASPRARTCSFRLRGIRAASSWRFSS